MSARVVLYTEAVAVGGAEVSLRNLCAALDGSIDVVVAGVCAQVVDMVAGARPAARGVVVPAVHGWSDVRGAWRLRRALVDLRPDLVHLNLTWAGSCPQAGVVALTLGCPVVAVEHLTLPTGGVRSRLAKQLTSRRLAAHVGVGARAARAVERDNGLVPDSLRVVHNGVPVVAQRPARPRRPDEAPLVGCLARFHEQKGLDVLLRALAQLPGVRAVLAGGGPERSALEALAAELGVDDRLELHDWCATPRDVLDRLDVFVLPSRYEGFPLSVVEAALAGVPVVATDVGSTREAVRDGDTGWLVAADDVDGLVVALRAALDDPTEAGRRAARAREQALASFTSDAMARGYEQVYADVLARPLGRSGG